MRENQIERKWQKFVLANTKKPNRKLRREQQEIDNRNFELQILSSVKIRIIDLWIDLQKWNKSAMMISNLVLFQAHENKLQISCMTLLGHVQVIYGLIRIACVVWITWLRVEHGASPLT